MSPITVLGAAGFIGSALVRRLEEISANYLAFGRDDVLTGRQLGHIIYCVGLTADFRSRPFETIDAHVCHLARVLRDCDFESLVYLSSARIYQNRSTPADEEDSLEVHPLNREELYNLSKLMGESLAHSSGRKTRVVRLSNVYGDDFDSNNFLPAVIKEALSAGKVTVRVPPHSEKDYVSIHDVVDGLLKIASEGKQSLYNLASGRNVPNQLLLQKISDATGCTVRFDPEAETKTFPPIKIDRMRSEFDFQPRYVLDDLDGLIDSYRRHLAESRTKAGN